jgi:hypothetical protein
MTQLETTSPELYEHFVNGGFSVQLRQANPFGRIPVNQTVEETVNKDTHTSGGTVCFSLNPGAVSRYYLTADHRAEVLRQLRKLVSLQSPGLGHADLQSSLIKRDEFDVTSILEILEGNWTNPFGNQKSDLVNISICAAAPPHVCANLLKAKDKGEEAYKMQALRLEDGSGFYEPIKKLKLIQTCNQRYKQKHHFKT